MSEAEVPMSATDDPFTDARVRDLLRLACSRLARAARSIDAPGGVPPLHFGQGFHDAWEEAQALVLGSLGLPWADAEALLDARLTVSELARLERCLDERIHGRLPTAYLTGVTWFAGLEFEVTPDVLIPRSPLGELLESGGQPWFGSGQPGTVLDLCCGSGCIGIAAARWLGAERLLLADLSEAALRVAARNVERHGLMARTTLHAGDLLAPLPTEARGSIDLILCNPPYVRAAVVDALPLEFRHEPRLALDGGADGMALVRRILDGAARWLATDGLLLLEVGADGAADLQAVLGPMPHEWPDWGAGICLIEAAALPG